MYDRKKKKKCGKKTNKKHLTRQNNMKVIIKQQQQTQMQNIHMRMKREKEKERKRESKTHISRTEL